MTSRVPFLFLTSPRCGSTMLRLALIKHPSIQIHYYCIAHPTKPRTTHEEWVAFQETTTDSHLCTFLFRQDTVAREQCPDPKRFWEMMRDRHDHYLCLYRENVLRQCFSNRVGAHPGGRECESPRGHQLDPMNLCLPYLRFFVKQMNTMLRDFDSVLPGRLTISYETLATDWRGTIQRIEEYLGLPALDLPVLTHRQETRPLREAISNYDEVAACVTDLGHPEWLKE